MTRDDTVPGRRPWGPAAAIAALVLAVGGLCAVAGDRECNHLMGDIAVAEPGTPRGSWCEAVQWHLHWLPVAIAAATLTFALILLAGRRPWLYMPAAGLGMAAAGVPALVMGFL